MHISVHQHKKYLSLSVVLWLLGLFSAYAQPGIEWQRTIGGQGWEELQAMTYTPDGGYLIGGTTSSGISGEVTEEGVNPFAGDPDCWVVKTNTDASVIDWQGRYGCEGSERIWDILPLPDGTYFLFGQSNSNACALNKSQDSRGGDDFWLIKISATGQRLWDRTYGGEGIDIGRKIVATDDGNYLLAGFSSSDSLGVPNSEKTIPSRGGFDYWVVKIAPDGDKIADYAFGGEPGDFQDEILVNVHKTEQGTFLLSGHAGSDAGYEKSTNSYGRNDFWMVHIDENGQKVGIEDGKPGDYAFGGNSTDVLREALTTRDGGYLLIGDSASDSGTGTKTSPYYGVPTDFSLSEDFWLVKLDADFNEVWQESYGGTGSDFVHVVWENRSGKIWIAGDSTSPPSGNKEDELVADSKDIWMLLLTPEGEKIWEQSYGGTSYEAPEQILQAHDGGYLIGAHSSSNIGFDKTEDSRGLNDFWLIKTNCSLTEAELDIETNVCNGEPFPLAPEFENCEDCTYQWQDGFEDTIRIVALTENTNFELLVTDSDGCEEDAVVQTIVQSNPEILELELTFPTCTDDTDGIISILEVDGGIQPYEYALSSDNFGTDTEYLALGAGEYEVVIRDSIGCFADSVVVLENPLLPLIDIGTDTIIELGDSLLVQIAVSPGIDTFYWANPSLVSCDTCSFTYIRPTGTTLYEIYGFNEQGCDVRDVKLVGIKRELPYYVPNAFSPNNDGNNDEFLIYPGAGLSAIRNMQIFDRWGNLMYKTDEVVLNNPEFAWDGNHRGRTAPGGIYIWMAEIEYIDGRKELIQGNVTLFR